MQEAGRRGRETGDDLGHRLRSDPRQGLAGALYQKRAARTKAAYADRQSAPLGEAPLLTRRPRRLSYYAFSCIFVR
jgi:hypothetical protein